MPQDPFHDQALIDAESVDHRIESRKQILSFAPPGAVCAELGVFTGLFSQEILRVAKPKKFHMVDPWHLAHGEFFPDWGPYNANGRLKTQTALDAATARTSPFDQQTEIQIHIAFSTDWLPSLHDEYLDWVYIDSSHQEEATLAELKMLEKKLSKAGIICGDDGWTDPASYHFGVFKAIQRFCDEGVFEIFYLDNFAQWALRRRSWTSK